MAQGQAGLANPLGIDATAHLSEKDLRDIQQYDRIVQFRDAVLSGNHPTIKLPPGVLAAARSPSSSKPTAPPSREQGPGSQNHRSYTANRDVTAQTSGSPAGPAATRSYGSGSTEINPIFLEKSAQLVRAEFQLQRQRLERALKEEVEQRRGQKQEKAEPLADRDLTDVLTRALTLVRATATPSAPIDEPLTANDEAASDSFDDDTFYSSKHDTPESNLTSRVRNESEEARRQVVPEPQRVSPLQPTNVSQHAVSGRNHEYQASASGDVKSTHAATDGTTPNAPGQFRVPGLNNYTNGAAHLGQMSQANTNGEPSQSEDSGVPYARGGSYGARNGPRRPDDAYIDTHPPSPLVRSHDMVPLAPQPAPPPSHVVVEQLAPTAEQFVDAARGAPAQVAALRNEPIAINSPDSSPQSGKGSDRKKGKKKKRKADRQAPEEVTPYIKPEPRSPSPMTAPSYIRPSKRQRQSQRQANELGQDSPAVTSDVPQRYEPRPYPDEPVQVGYGVPGVHPQRPASTTVVGNAGSNGVFMDERRLPDGAYVRREASPRYIQPPPSGTYTSRPVSQLVVDDGYREPPRTYREPYDAVRTSARPEADPYVGQPMPPPTRIIVDSFGREYIEPPRPPIRQSVAPGPPYGPEVVYERPLGAVSRHPGPTTYDDNRGVLYTRSSSVYPGARRVVTQPDYVSQDFRDGRPREYSVRPGAPPAEYVQVMAPPERQLGIETPREYGARAASVRPMEPVRYEIPREHGRVQSVWPEAPAQDFPSSVHTEGRREAAQPYIMEYGSRPVEQPVYQRGFSVRPVERYYDQQQPSLAGENIAFIERPGGATQEIVYADSARREVHR